MEIEFHAFFFFFFLIGHNSTLYKSSISLKLDFKVTEYRNKGILLNFFKNKGEMLESPKIYPKLVRTQDKTPQKGNKQCIQIKGNLCIK